MTPSSSTGRRGYVPPHLRGKKKDAVAVGATSANTNNSASVADTLADKKPSASVNLIKTKGDQIFGLLNQNIQETDKILIIDFENIRRRILGEENLYREQMLAKNLGNEIKKLSSLDGRMKRKILKSIVDERQHLLAWIFIIKFYANHSKKDKRFDKIIIICKQKTWDEWFDYAFSLFENPEDLKSKFLTINLKISDTLDKRSDEYKGHTGMDDFVMYIIKHYLHGSTSIPSVIE